MMRSMFSGVMGLRAHQTKMDVIGNNVSNVNTAGYKASRAAFSDVMSQVLRGDSPPTPTSGGVNIMQVGLGAMITSVDAVFSQGGLQLTNRSTDMAIQGQGFFVIGDRDKLAYTRAGNFSRDASGYMVNTAGMRVKGWVADSQGQFGIKDKSNLTDIQIVPGATVLPVATTTVRFGESLDAEAAVGAEYTTAIGVFDTLGTERTVTIKFRKVAGANTWDWAAFDATGATLLNNGGAGDQSGTVDGAAGQSFPPSGVYPGAGGQLRFNSDGSLQSIAPGVPVYSSFVLPAAGGATAQTIHLDLTSVTQPVIPGAQGSTVKASQRDGSPMGGLDDFTIDNRGTIFAIFSNGVRRPVAQVALAGFANPEGLMRVGHTAFSASNNSGLEQIGEAGTGGRGTIAPSNLEMSNVDLGAEFTEMIITQRGFQANSRTITAADEMLQELVNLRR